MVGVTQFDFASEWAVGFAARTESGSVLTFGSNGFDRLHFLQTGESRGAGAYGTGTYDLSVTPTALTVAGLSSALSVATTGNYARFALRSDGSVWAWGSNDREQLGGGKETATATARPIPGLQDVRAICAGFAYGLALKSDGTVWVWGQLFPNTAGSSPGPIAGLSNITTIACGTYHILAARSDGTLWAMGFNGSGQLGDGTQVNRTVPVQVSGFQFGN